MGRLLTCAQIAQKYGVSDETVRRWIRTGRLTAFQIGRMWRVYESDLAAFVTREGIRKRGEKTSG